MYLEIKSEISSTVVQLTVKFYNETNEQQRNFKDL